MHGTRVHLRRRDGRRSSSHRVLRSERRWRHEPASANPGPFPARQGPAGAVDLDDSAGRGGRTWARFGLAWLVLAGTLGFVGRWHDWDATALDSLASLGWSYDDGSGLATTISMTLRTGLVMVFIGTTLTATARTSGGRLAAKPAPR